jgi:hypothetical protein
MPVEFHVRNNVDGVRGFVIDYDVAPGQPITAAEATAIAAAETADAVRRIEQQIASLGSIANKLAHPANQGK